MNELYILILTAASLGFIHTLLGPDHYLPFIVLSKARNWSRSKTMWITLISGVGHVAGSVVLGVAGVAMGISLTKLERIESSRSELVGWLMIAFGFLYTVYGVYKFLHHTGHRHLPAYLVPKSIRNKMHLPTSHASDKEDKTRLTPWVLFLIFVFGPCEVLIPLLIYPAAQHDAVGIFAVSAFFGIATILTMLTVVTLGHKGTSFLNLKKGEKYMHGIAGMVILMSGIGMKFLGW